VSVGYGTPDSEMYSFALLPRKSIFISSRNKLLREA